MVKSLFTVFSLLVISSVLLSCVDDFDMEVSHEAFLVINGLITTELGPHEVELYRYNNAIQKKENVEGAKVVLRDEAGNEEEFREESPGVYRTASEFMGEVGNCYVLEVELQNGKRYISDPEEIEKGVELDSIYWENGVVEYISDLGNLFKRNVINVYIDGGPIGNETKNYRWRYKNIFELITNPELNFSIDPMTGETIPDPLECSGYIVDPFSGNIMQVGPCICCQCYVTEFGNKAVVSQARFVSHSFQRIKVASFDLDSRFSKRFYIEVEQLSLSDNSHEFWSLISKQADNNSVFAPPPGPIASNIYSLDDNDSEQVLGFFSACDISSRSLFIERSQIPKFVPELVSYEDCRARENSTNIEPDFW